MKIKLIYPGGVFKDIEFEPGKMNYEFRNVNGDSYYKLQILDKDCSSFNRLNIKLLAYELKRLRVGVHPLSCDISLGYLYDLIEEVLDGC